MLWKNTAQLRFRVPGAQKPWLVQVSVTQKILVEGSPVCAASTKQLIVAVLQRILAGLVSCRVHCCLPCHPESRLHRQERAGGAPRGT